MLTVMFPVTTLGRFDELKDTAWIFVSEAKFLVVANSSTV